METAEVQVRSKCRRHRELIGDGSIGGNVERSVGDIGGSSVNKLELRPPHLLELLVGGILEEALRLGPGKGETGILPAEC